MHMQARIVPAGALCSQTYPDGTRRTTQLRSYSPSASCQSAPLSPHTHRNNNVDQRRRCRRRRRHRREALSTPAAVAALSFLSRPRDPGDWDFSPEWYGTQGGGYGRDDGVVVYRSGEVVVTAHPSSSGGGDEFEWRVLRFGDTRQSVSLVKRKKKAGEGPPSPPRSSSLSPPSGQVALEPTCLAFEYTKTLVALSLALLPLPEEEEGEEEEKKKKKQKQRRRKKKVLCVGVGGGSVPAALAALRPDVEVSAFEVDERVVGSWPSMGLLMDAAPSRADSSSSSPDADADAKQNANAKNLNPTSSSCNNLRLERRCGAEAVAAVAASHPGSLDLLIVDAFDAEDEVPALFTDPGRSAFFADAARALAPRGAALINLHCGPRPGPAAALAAMFSFNDNDGEGGSGGGGAAAAAAAAGPYSSSVAFDAKRGQGKEAVSVARAYASALLDPSSSSSSSASAFLVAARRQQNAIGVVARAGLLALRTTQEGEEEEEGSDSEGPANSSSSSSSSSSSTPVVAVDAAALSAAASRGAAACAVSLPFDVGSRANYGVLKL